MFSNPFLRTCLVIVPLALAASAMTLGEDDKKHTLPPGWTEADMKACIEAGTPGRQHEQLHAHVGTWNGKQTMWMAPDAPPINTECVATTSTMLDGRFTRCDVVGEMPGMGPFNGLGIYGFDNVSQKYVSSWLDNCGTGIAQGTGEASADGKTLTWTYVVNCPIQKKPVTMREIERMTGDRTYTMEMYTTDPKSGREFKTMQIEFTKQ